MNSAKRNALGRGLGALLNEAVEIQNNAAPAPSKVDHPTAASISQVALSQIDANPYQPRLTFDPVAIAELAESIRNVGIIQPVTLRRLNSGRYQIISGERRCRAASLAGLSSVPAYIRTADDAGMLEMAIVENIQRENLDPIETALSFQRLIDECRLTQEEMADRVGKKRATVTNFLRLLKLPAEIQKALKVGKLSTGHAKVLLSVEDENLQLSLAQDAIMGEWSVRFLEDKVRSTLSRSGATTKKPVAEKSSLPDDYYRVLEVVGRYFDNNISLKRSASGKGSMTIRFNSDEEIAHFLKALEAIDN